jgi:hypothetical protein
MRAGATKGPDELTDDEREFLRHRDGFYDATVSQTGCPTCDSAAVRWASCT